MKIISAVTIMVILLLSFYYINYEGEKSFIISNLLKDAVQKDEIIKIMTYNIHRGINNNGVYDFRGTISTIGSSGAQIIGLNEVDNKMLRSGFRNQVSILAEELRMNYIFGPALKSFIGSYGNAILSVFPIKNVKNYSLPVNIGQEPRSVLTADLELPGGDILKVLVTHLSTERELRGKQQMWLHEYLKTITKPFILMGDFNTENIYFTQKEGFLRLAAETYPTSKPVLQFDQFITNCEITEESYIIKTNASDHLPLIIEFPLSYNNK